MHQTNLTDSAKYMPVSAAARILGKSPDTIVRYLKKGILDGSNCEGSWSVTVLSVAAWEAEYGGTAAKAKAAEVSPVIVRSKASRSRK